MHNDEIKPMIIPSSKYEKVIEKVCSYYGVPPNRIHIKGRKRNIALCRQVISYLFRKYTKEGLQRIGEILRPTCPYDHTTILYGVKKVSGLIEVDTDFAAEYKIIEEQIMGEMVSSTTNHISSLSYKQQIHPPIKGFIRPY